VGGREWTVVGVVDDVAYEARGIFGRKVYVPHAQYVDNRNWNLVEVIESSLPLPSLIQQARSLVNNLDPELVIYRPMSVESLIATERARERFAALLMVIFASVALSMAATGLYGVFAYLVGQRTHEIGIRMALGAPSRRMRTLILRHVGLVVTGGVVAGVGVSMFATRLLESLVFEINPRDPGMLAAVSVVVVLVSLLAGLLPARRAARVSPGQVLR